jgi:glycosyltransferase involved in cell wall biosynthesis
VRLGIDARELTGEATGVGRYLARLLREWALAPDGTRVTLYSPDGRIALPAGLSGEVAIVDGAGGTRWEQFDLAAALRRDRPDVFFAPGYTAPLRTGVPTVVAIHDVSFAAHPEWFSWREGTRRRLLTRWSARRAARVITISDFSRHQIVARLGVPDDRVRVITLGAGLEAAPAPAEARTPLVLFVGTLLNRRHLPLLIDAFVRVATSHPTAELVIVGRNRTHPFLDVGALAAQTPVASRIRVADWIPDADLAALYRKATAFAFLSEYEGLGLTPLEALSAGVAPVVLDTPVAREAYGEAALRVTTDVTDVAGALAAALDPSSDRRAAVMRAAPAVLARYDWRRTAAATLAVLQEASAR